MASAPAKIRSLYRGFLRELPARHPSILASPSPIQKHIRQDLETPSISDGHTTAEQGSALHHQAQQSSADRVAQAEQYIQYLKHQRIYATLIERYNPGMNMDDEERIRLTARRVGMNLPVDVLNKDGQGR